LKVGFDLLEKGTNGRFGRRIHFLDRGSTTF
jgi:hypothetical protein